jgi:hypothetical protein
MVAGRADMAVEGGSPKKQNMIRNRKKKNKKIKPNQTHFD